MPLDFIKAKRREWILKKDNLNTMQN